MTLRAELDAAKAAIDRALAQLPTTGGPITPTPGRRILRPGASSAKLQDALNSCEPGDVIALDRTHRYEQEYTFDRDLDPPVMVVTDDTRNAISEKRIGPADAPNLATLSSGNAMPVLTILGKGLDLVALQILSQRGQNEIIAHGTNDSPFAGSTRDPERITYDRILIEAPGDCKRAIRGHGKTITVSRCHIAGIVRAGQDCQAFFASRGSHFVLRNSYLGASGENFLFGGEDNPEGTNPTDILVEDCHLHKPQAWRQVRGSVKNLGELKNATKVRIRRNLFEGCWTDAQNGFAILFSSMNQDGRSPWTILDDITFDENWVKSAEHGFNFTGHDGIMHDTRQSRGFVVRRNVVQVGGVLLQVGGEIADLTFEDNVSDNGYNIATFDPGGVKLPGGGMRPAAFCVGALKFNRNLARHNDYGIHPGGIDALTSQCQTVEFLNNRFVGTPGHYRYPLTTGTLTLAQLETAKQALLAEQGWS